MQSISKYVCCNVLLLAMVVSVAFAQTTYPITGDGADVQLYADGETVWIGQKDHRVGRGSTSNGVKDSVSLFVFALPALDGNDTITDAHLVFNSTGGSWSTPPCNMNLYGLGYRTAVSVTADDFFQGSFGSDATDATPIQQDFGITWPDGDPHAADGTYGTDATGDQALVDYLAAQYAAGATGGEYVLLRLNLETALTDSKAYWVGSGDNDNPPVLTITVNGASAAELPVADAGTDQMVNDNDGDGSESVTLDGSASADPDGTLVSYGWTEGGLQIATGATANVTLALGVHTVTLTVTDDSGYTDTDTVVVTVVDPNANEVPTANAGIDQNVVDGDADGSEDVILDGAGSSDTDGTIASYVWTEGGSQIATGVNPAVTLALGTHSITLTVTDDRGATDTDTVIVNVSDGSGPTPLPVPDPNYVPPTPPDPNGNQLLNLYGQNLSRPVTYERVWPANPGEAYVCLYHDDKFGAINICIDDNTSPDHDWWRGICQTYGINVSFMCVVDALSEYSGNSFYSNWGEMGALFADGINVQSHSMTHQPNDNEREDYLIHYEYAESIRMIETEIPGNKVITIAYPYGNGKPEIAALYYIAARCTIGTVNTHNQIDYMNVHSGGSIRDNVDVILTGSSSIAWHGPASMRGWMSHTYHFVPEDSKPALEVDIAYAASQEELWIGTFEDIAMYCQERDSSTLTVTAADATQIAFTLTDRMMDSIFTFPLTVKVRLYDGWTDVTATQDGEPIEATVVEHDGGAYALVKAVPDAGDVLLLPAAAAKPGDADGDGDVDLNDFVILKANFGAAPLTDARADFDKDGDIDLGDFVILKTNFGT